jgi:hypothetical protein
MSNADARRMFLRVLRRVSDHPDQYRINFEIHSFHVTNAAFGQVCQAIADQRIGVRYDRTMEGRTLEEGGEQYRRRMLYQPTVDRFLTPVYSTGGDAQIRALIIHEAVHAYADLVRARWMHIETSEASAYIAQSLFYYYITNSGGRGRLGSEDENYDALFQAAWDVALILAQNGTPRWGEYEAVRTAVGNIAAYQSQTGPRPYHGVRAERGDPAIAAYRPICIAPHSSAFEPRIGPRRQNLLKLA